MKKGKKKECKDKKKKKKKGRENEAKKNRLNNPVGNGRQKNRSRGGKVCVGGGWGVDEQRRIQTHKRLKGR